VCVDLAWSDCVAVSLTVDLFGRRDVGERLKGAFLDQLEPPQHALRVVGHSFAYFDLGAGLHKGALLVKFKL
jgi:hypothetical protein